MLVQIGRVEVLCFECQRKNNSGVRGKKNHKTR